jgi:uncharacterized protein YegP (UPF0339 family)
MWAVIRGVLVAAVLAAVLGVVGSPMVTGQQKKGADKGIDGKGGTAVFEVYTDKGGKYRFRLTQGDELLAIAGHGYESKQDCLKVIDTIRKVAAKAKIEDKSKAGPKGK